MEFFTRVLSGNSRLKERAREAEQVNQTFKENLDNLKRLLESEESEDVLALLDMVYDSSFPEEQVFMKTPSRARLKSKKELVVRLLIGLDSLGVPAMAEMLAFVRKHGAEGLADNIMTLLEFLSPLLEGKEAPEFSTDDVLNAMDLEWHSTSRTGSPLLNVIASATSSPRASTASIGDSPFHPIISGSPYRRTISDRSMLVSRAHELGAKSVLDKTSTASTPPQPYLTMSTSLQYPSAKQDFRSSELTILKTPASPEITQVSTDEKPSSYSLDTLPESRSQRRHRRKSSSLHQLFAEDTIDELSREGSVGASSKRNSSSSSWRRNSSDFTKILTNTSEASSPINHSLAAADSREAVTVAPDKEFLSSIYTQAKHSQKGSHRISPSPPDEVALWREDSGGFRVDLVSSDKNAAQTSVFGPVHLKSSGDIHETEGHADGVEASSLSEDLIKSSKSNILEQDNILQPCHDSSPLSNKDFGESVSTMSQTPQGIKSDFASMPDDELSEAKEQTNKLISEEEPIDCIDVKRGRFGNLYYSTEETLEIDLPQNGVEESEQDANEHYRDGKSEAINLSKTNDDLESTFRHEYSKDEFNKSEDADVHSTSDNEHADGSGDESKKFEDVYVHSISDNDHLNVDNVYGFGANSSHENTYSSSESDENDSSSSQIPSTSKSSTLAKVYTADCNSFIKDQLNKNAFEADLDILLQSNVFQHGHQRSHSDLTPLRILFKAESLKQEKLNPWHGSESDSHEKTDKLRRKFARCLGSMTASMESLRSRGGSVDRVVMQESMPWSHKNQNNHSREEASEEHEKGSLSDASSDESTSSDLSASSTNGVTVTDNNELLNDQHPHHHVKADENLQELPILDALNMRSTALTDCTDTNGTLQAPAFLESSPRLGEARLEENLQSKDGQSLMQEALEVENDTYPGEEVNAQKSSLDEGFNSSLDTDSVNNSLNENIKLEMADLMGNDEKKETVQPLADVHVDNGVHVDNVSRPFELEGHLKVSDDQFKKLLSELDAGEEDVLCNDGELPVVNVIEGGQLGMHDDKMEGKSDEEDSAARGLDKEKMQLHDDKMGIVDENTLSKESSEEEFLDNTGQFIMGGPRYIPALVELDDCNHMQDHCQAHQENLNLQDAEQGCMLQYFKGVHDVVSDTTSAGQSTPFVNVNNVDSHVVASTKECRGSKEASMVSKEDQDKQCGLECPTILVEDALQEGEVSKPCWEASELVGASGSHPLHDKDLIRHRSLAQILDAGFAAQSTKPRDIDQLTVQFRDCGTRYELLSQFADASESRPLQTLDDVKLLTQVQEASESQPLHDVDDYIERPAAHFTEPYTESPAQISDYDLASQSTNSRAVQSTDTESVGQFTGSGTQYAHGSESQPVDEDDYIERRAAHLTKPYTGSFTAGNSANGDMRAGLVASLEDNEHQNADHVFPLSNKTDPPAYIYAHLHGHPTSLSTLSHVDSQQQSDQHVLNQPAAATSSDPNLDRWDAGTNDVPRSNRKGSYMGKWTRGCLSCCTKPRTNP